MEIILAQIRRIVFRSFAGNGWQPNSLIDDNSMEIKPDVLPQADHDVDLRYGRALRHAVLNWIWTMIKFEFCFSHQWRPRWSCAEPQIKLRR